MAPSAPEGNYCGYSGNMANATSDHHLNADLIKNTDTLTTEGVTGTNTPIHTEVGMTAKALFWLAVSGAMATMANPMAPQTETMTDNRGNIKEAIIIFTLAILTHNPAHKFGYVGVAIPIPPHADDDRGEGGQRSPQRRRTTRGTKEEKRDARTEAGIGDGEVQPGSDVAPPWACVNTSGTKVDGGNEAGADVQRQSCRLRHHRKLHETLETDRKILKRKGE